MLLICSHGPVLTMWQEWRMANSFVWLSMNLAPFSGHVQLSVACIQYTVFLVQESKNLLGMRLEYNYCSRRLLTVIT